MPVKNQVCNTICQEMIESAIKAAKKIADDLPDAAPLDLLSKNAYQRLDAYLEKNYGPLRKFIDENYVALLIALSQYEKVDLKAKINAHMVHNIMDA